MVSKMFFRVQAIKYPAFILNHKSPISKKWIKKKTAVYVWFGLFWCWKKIADKHDECVLPSNDLRCWINCFRKWCLFYRIGKMVQFPIATASQQQKKNLSSWLAFNSLENETDIQ